MYLVVYEQVPPLLAPVCYSSRMVHITTTNCTGLPSVPAPLRPPLAGTRQGICSGLQMMLVVTLVVEVLARPHQPAEE